MATRTSGRLLLALLVMATACTVGPKYRPPEPPTVTRYGAAPLPAETASADVPGGEPQQLLLGRDVAAEWWTVFRSPALDALVRRALADSPRLAAATAKLTKAQEDLVARRGKTRYPSVDARLSATRVDVDPDSLGVPQLPVEMPLTLYDASASVSYTLDLFGKSRRELEALAAEVDYQRFELEAARLMLAGNVVTAAIREASLRAQIERTERVVTLYEELLRITERREQLGGVARVEVDQQRVLLAATRADLPGLGEELERTRHRLAIYLGQPPGGDELPELRLADLQLPTELPLTLPSELARRRPDIQAAEALLHRASAEIGVATANLYPRITLSASGGSLATALGSVFSGGTWFYLLGGTLIQNVFHGGELKAEKRAAVAAFDQAGAAYRDVLLVGLGDVADVLSALEADAATLRDRAAAAGAAKAAYDIASSRYEVGGISHLALLEAERQYASATIAETRAIAERYADSAALFQALGGGWSVEE
jgi:NodT family efflux transporter outer membrane factor (OMF) lipoprotein